MSTHELTVEIEPGNRANYREASIALVCHAAIDAPCRNRPPNWETRESWDDEEATLTGFPCWAVEFFNDGGPEVLIYRGKREGSFNYTGPIDVWFEDAVAWSEPDEATR